MLSKEQIISIYFATKHEFNVAELEENAQKCNELNKLLAEIEDENKWLGNIIFEVNNILYKE